MQSPLFTRAHSLNTETTSPTKDNRRFFKLALLLIACFCFGSALLISGAFLYLSPKLPSAESLRDITLQTPLRIYSRDNKLIGEFGEKRRTPVKYSDVPDLMIKAFLAAEDDQFEQHHGVDIGGLLRAVSQLLTTGHIQSGGSTITMQVARNYFLTLEQTFIRKFNEILLAVQIERELSKKEIMELYLNKIYLGKRAYGIEAAAQVYYGKSISDLDLAQFAMIAGLPKAPSTFNPLANPERALVRRNWILQRMLSLGHIDEGQFTAAHSSPITASYHGTNITSNAQYAAEMARQFVIDRYGLQAYSKGYRVSTTIDARLQNSAQYAVIRGLLTYDKRHGYRGPERNFAAEPDDSDPENWQNLLAQIPTIGGLEPAVVLETQEQQIIALLREGESITIDWENGLSDARPFRTINSRGAKPDKASDIVKPGAVIRVIHQDEQWHLSQIPEAQAALVSLNPENGAIIAVVGGFEFRHSKFNRAMQAERQPGSNIKPVIYSAALENGFTAATLINDAPVVFDDNKLESTWRPENASGKFFGPTTLRTALVNSRNLVSIRLLRKLTVRKAVEYLARFGIDPAKLPRDLSLALGTHAMTPMEVATAYAVFANGGYRISPYLVARIENSKGELLYQAKPATVCRDCELAKGSTPKKPTEHQEAGSLEELLAIESTVEKEESLPAAPNIMDTRVAYIIDSFLKDVVKRGTGRKALALGRNDLRGKTGTTNGPTDAWFSGYGGNLVTTAWVGFDENQKLGRREYGGTAALPIWIDFMRVGLAGITEKETPRPDGLVSVRINPKTGQLAAPDSTEAVFELFREEYAPTQSENLNGYNTHYEQSGELPESIF